MLNCFLFQRVQVFYLFFGQHHPLLNTAETDRASQVTLLLHQSQVACSWLAREVIYRMQNLKLCDECSRTLGMGWKAAVEADAIREQQLKRTQLGAADEADAIREHAAAEADAIGEQQLKRTQSESSSSAQRPFRRRITHLGEPGVAEQAKRAKLLVYIIYVAQFFLYQKCN